MKNIFLLLIQFIIWLLELFLIIILSPFIIICIIIEYFERKENNKYENNRFTK